MVWVAGALDASTTAELLALYQEWQRLTAAQVSKNQVPLFFTTLFSSSSLSINCFEYFAREVLTKHEQIGVLNYLLLYGFPPGK